MLNRKKSDYVRGYILTVSSVNNYPCIGTYGYVAVYGGHTPSHTTPFQCNGNDVETCFLLDSATSARFLYLFILVQDFSAKMSSKSIKRKCKVLNIETKVKIIERFGNGEVVAHLANEYEVGVTKLTTTLLLTTRVNDSENSDGEEELVPEFRVQLQTALESADTLMQFLEQEDDT